MAVNFVCLLLDYQIFREPPTGRKETVENQVLESAFILSYIYIRRITYKVVSIKHIIGIRIYFFPCPDLPSLKKKTKEEIISWKTLYRHANETDVIPA